MSGSDGTLSGSQMTPGGKAFEVDFAAWSKEGKAFQAEGIGRAKAQWQKRAW